MYIIFVLAYRHCELFTLFPDSFNRLIYIQFSIIIVTNCKTAMAFLISNQTRTLMSGKPGILI